MPLRFFKNLKFEFFKNITQELISIVSAQPHPHSQPQRDLNILFLEETAQAFFLVAHDIVIDAITKHRNNKI